MRSQVALARGNFSNKWECQLLFYQFDLLDVQDVLKDFLIRI